MTHLAEPRISPTGDDLRIELAHESDASEIVGVVHAAFGARAQVDPPPPALQETAETIARELRSGGGVVARLGGEVIGAIIVTAEGEMATLRRVSVHPDHQHTGVASLMVPAADQVAASLGCRLGTLVVRREFPGLVAWWQRSGYHVVAQDDLVHRLQRHLPVLIPVPDADAMRALGGRLAKLTRPGDLVLLEGELGAGKTTLAQGFGAGLGITEPITSPTFVLSRVYRTDAGPDLIHVDAYRIADADELDDLDLPSSVGTTDASSRAGRADAPSSDAAIILVEWGSGRAEHLSENRLWVTIERHPDDEERTVLIDGHGPRWALDLGILAEPQEPTNDLAEGN